MKKVSFLSFLFTILMLSAQSQDFISSQYYSNLPAVNPGFTGIEDYVDVKFSGYQGWNGFGIRNNNFYASAFGALNNSRQTSIKNNALRLSNSAYTQIETTKDIRRRHGMGGIISGRNLGPYRSVRISYQYAYHLPLSKFTYFSFGTRVGYLAERIDFSDLTVREPVNDEVYNRVIAANVGNQNSYVVDFGALLYTKTFYLGISTNHLVKGVASQNVKINLIDVPQYQLQTAANFALGANFMCSPGATVRYLDGYDLNWVANTRFKYKDFIYAGAGYGSGSQLSMLLGLTFGNKLQLHYAYDQYMSSLSNFNVNAHEIVLGLVMANRTKSQPKFW